MREHDPTTDYYHTLVTPSRYLNHLRAIFEPTIVQHFGDVMDGFVRTAERRWSVEGSMQDERARNPRATGRIPHKSMMIKYLKLKVDCVMYSVCLSKI
jgi:hypothetical protein